MDNKVSKELAFHRLEQAKDDLKASKTLYKEKSYAESLIKEVEKYIKDK